MPLPPRGALNAVQQQRQLLRAQALAAAFAPRGGKAASLEPFETGNTLRHDSTSFICKVLRFGVHPHADFFSQALRPGFVR
jgi:hypothetical protein